MQYAPSIPAFLVAFTVAATASGQQAADAQSRFEPRSKPGAGQAFLKRFVGDWNVEKSFFPASGEPIRVHGTCRQTMIHDGRFLQSEFQFGDGQNKSTGLGLIGFQSETDRFTSIWTDSRSTKTSFRQSAAPFDGNQIVLESRSLENEPSDGRKSRTVTVLLENDAKIRHQQFVASPDGGDRLIMELILTRQK
jgi:hypothetical protein